MKKDKPNYGRASFDKLGSGRMFRVEQELLTLQLQHLHCLVNSYQHNITSTMKQVRQYVSLSR